MSWTRERPKQFIVAADTVLHRNDHFGFARPLECPNYTAVRCPDLVGPSRWHSMGLGATSGAGAGGPVLPLAGVWAGRYPKRRVGAKRIRPLDAQQTAKFDAGTVDAALDGTDCTMSNLGSLLVGVPAAPTTTSASC